MDLRIGLISLLPDAFIYFCLRTPRRPFGPERIKVRINPVSKKLQLHFSHAFQGDIWQQSLSGPCLLITSRDHEALQVSFSLLHLPDGQFWFEGMTFDEPWWIDVYHFYDQTIVFQVYEDSNDIEQKSYLAIDIHDHEVIWTMDKVAATGRHGHYLQLKSLEAGDVLFYLDVRSGETFTSMPENNSDEAISEGLRHPLLYTEESPFFDTIKAFGSKKLGKDIVGACNYLEHNQLVFLAYHYPKADLQVNELVVLNHASKPILQRVLHEGNSGLVADAFFIAHEQLIFVEGKNTLNSYIINN